MSTGRLNMVTGLAGDVLIAAHTSTAPSDAEWEAYLDVARAQFQKVPVERQALGFTITEGGAPNSKQRMRMNQVVAGRSVRGAILSTSTVVRGVVTALTWFHKDLSVFAPDRFESAADFLGLSSAQREDVRREADALRARIGLPPAFQLPAHRSAPR